MPVPTIMAGGAILDPRLIANLKGWYAADRSIVGVTSGNPFTTVTDLSGQGNTGTSSGSPTWVTNQQNGKPCMRFVAASSQYVAVNGLAASLTGTDVAHSVFVVAKPADVTGTYDLFGAGRNAASNPRIEYRTNNTPRFVALRRDDAGTLKNPNGGTPAAAALVLSVVFNGTTVDAWHNGTQVLTAQDLDVGATTLDRATIGALDSGGAPASFFNGDIYEVTVYNRALVTAERRALERSLGSKWGVTVV